MGAEIDGAETGAARAASASGVGIAAAGSATDSVGTGRPLNVSGRDAGRPAAGVASSVVPIVVDMVKLTASHRANADTGPISSRGRRMLRTADTTSPPSTARNSN